MDPKFSFRAPQISSLSKATVDPGGSAVDRTIVISGNHFGPPGAPVNVTIGGSYCVSFTHTSDDSITCEVPPGAGYPRTVEIISGGQTDDETSFGYTSPLFTSVTPPVLATSGLGFNSSQEILTIIGKHFGMPANGHSVLVEFGDGGLTTPCASLVHVSDTEIQCNAPDWGGRDLDIEITVDAQTSSTPDVLDYAPPAISFTSVKWSYPDTGYNGPDWIPNGVLAPNFPNPKITITGVNFGSSASPFFASSGFQATIGT